MSSRRYDDRRRSRDSRRRQRSRSNDRRPQRSSSRKRSRSRSRRRSPPRRPAFNRRSADTYGRRNPRNPVIFLELEILLPLNMRNDPSKSEDDLYRLEIELFKDHVPQTTERFQKWCRRGDYEDCPFHRIIPDFMAQGGDVTHQDGTGGKIDGVTYNDENFRLRHDRPYMLSCANAGKNKNTTQFFITFKRVDHLNGKHVVFGEVLEGTGAVKRDTIMKLIEKCGHESGAPKGKVIIKDCGEVMDTVSD